MELRLTPEQSLLRDSAAKFIVTAGPKVARGFRAQVPSFAPARLRAAGELGWLGIIVPASRTGLGPGSPSLRCCLSRPEKDSSVSRSGLLPSRPLPCHSGHIQCSRR
jgi:alkylation response protein AidB-like acyl-CoA dehydrogenase